MQLYRTTYVDEDKKVVNIWSASKTDASKARTAAKHEGYKNPVTEPVDVPTKKEELIAWLNANN